MEVPDRLAFEVLSLLSEVASNSDHTEDLKQTAIDLEKELGTCLARYQKRYQVYSFLDEHKE